MSRVQVMTGVGRRRRWSQDQKRAVVAAAFAPGAGAEAGSREHNSRKRRSRQGGVRAIASFDCWHWVATPRRSRSRTRPPQAAKVERKHPGFERGDERRAAALTLGLALGRGLAGDLRLDREDRIDAPHRFERERHPAALGDIGEDKEFASAMRPAGRLGNRPRTSSLLMVLLCHFCPDILYVGDDGETDKTAADRDGAACGVSGRDHSGPIARVCCCRASARASSRWRRGLSRAGCRRGTNLCIMGWPRRSGMTPLCSGGCAESLLIQIAAQ
jgi:hypothetical protein